MLAPSTIVLPSTSKGSLSARANLVGELAHVDCAASPSTIERELVAGDARDAGRAGGERLQPLRGQPQHLVADRMPPDVVHGAEAVEADDHQSDLLIGRGGALDRVVERRP